MGRILDVYRENYPLYNDFTSGMQEIVTALLMKQNIRVHSVVSRIKEESSLDKKINKNCKKYACIEEITDVCGIRIITYFEDEVDLIADMIQENLAIDPINSVDKRKILAATQFGYLSVHFVAGLTTSQLQLPKYRKFEKCKIEIQICSMLQHAWAEIEHDLGYKSQIPISYDKRRSFSRLASLLEMADIEFKRLRNDLQPSCVLVSKPALTSVTHLPEKIIPATVGEKLMKKFYVVRALGSGITEHTEFTVKKASGYTLMSIIMVLLATHLVSIFHFSIPIVATLKIEKTFLISLLSIQRPV